MPPVNPTPQQLSAMAGEGPDGPVVMVNLLKYRTRAAYADGRPEAKEGLSGHAAYRRYGAVAVKCIGEVGGSIVWAGEQKFALAGGSEQDWDEVACVRYPSRKAFLEMIARTDYLAATYHREAGLERTVLLCCAAGTAS